MEIGAVVERIEHIAAIRTDAGAGADLIQSGLVAVREARAWLDAQHAGLVAQLRPVDSFPEKRIADADKTSIGNASKTTERSSTLGSTPKLAEALGDGAITAAHIDALTRASRKLEPAQRRKLMERADTLAAVAAAATVDDFARRMDAEARRLQTDDGSDRLEQQRRNTRVSTWVDRDGMWNLRGSFDPVTGVKLAAKLTGAVQTLFAKRVPEFCPSDPFEKQRFLAAHALVGLLDGAHTGTAGNAEFVVVIDADATDQPGPVAEFAIPVEIPARVLADLLGVADVCTVVVRNGIVLHAPGNLDLGRSTRLANRAQRRALRGLYRGCAIPGCTVGYDRCELHHITWWRNGGRTDLDNLIPICTIHHGKIHNDAWVLELGPNRELTLRLPDGTIHTTGPPTRRRTTA